MPVTQFTDAVEIEGSQDITQLAVQGHTTQTEPLQTWQDGAEAAQAQLTGDGRFQIGSFDDGMMATDDALIEAHRHENAATKPKRGLHLLGEVTGLLDSLVSWVVQELALKGSAAISGLHSTLRVRLRHGSSGDSSDAELLAADVEAVNETGTPAARLGQLTGLRTAISNGENGYIDQAVGLDVRVSSSNPDTEDAPINTAYGIRVGDVDQASTNYALYTGAGAVHFGNALELPVLPETPSDNPPTGFFKVYFKVEDETPRLFVKDADGKEHEIVSGGASNSKDYVSILTTNRSGTTSQIGQVGILLRGEWYVLGEYVGLLYQRKRQLNSNTPASWQRTWDYFRCGVALEAISEGEDLHVAIDGRVSVIGDGEIDAGDIVKLSSTNPGRLINGISDDDIPVGHAVTACEGAGESFTVDLWTAGQNTSRGSFVLGDSLLGKLGGPGVLG